MRRNILLIEPNYKNKYPPIGLMKISTYHKKLGDNVTFFKGDLKDFVFDQIYEECFNKLEAIDEKVHWRIIQDQIKKFIKTKESEILSNKDLLKSNYLPLIKDCLEYYRAYFIKGKYKKEPKWDRVYITTLFTFYWKITIETINFAKIFVKDIKELKVGGVMASLLSEEIERETKVKPIKGLLDKPRMLDAFSSMIIDNQPLDYSILDEINYNYHGIDSYYTYMTKGCKNNCPFCAVPKIEPEYKSKIPTIKKFNQVKKIYGDKQNLILMDNNVLASPEFSEIVKEIKKMGFYKGATYIEPNQLEISIRNLKDGLNDKAYIKRSFNLIHNLMTKLTGTVAQYFYDTLDEYSLLQFNTATKDNLLLSYSKISEIYERYRNKTPKLRYVDFNQGIDCRKVTDKNMKVMSELPIRPLRIAFDDIRLKKLYIEAVELAAMYGIKEFSNYILYNYHDTPEDLYRRLKINTSLSQRLGVHIYSFPMKYIPVIGELSKNRDYTASKWNKKFIGAIQAILNVNKGIVAPPSKNGKGRSFFNKAFGNNIKEFKELLYMPETFIIYRKLFEVDLGYTGKWQESFNALNRKEFNLIKPIIEGNDFSNYETIIKNSKLLKILKYYSIKRDDVEGTNNILEIKNKYDRYLL